jgi:hypothetical protein
MTKITNRQVAGFERPKDSIGTFVPAAWAGAAAEQQAHFVAIF